MSEILPNELIERLVNSDVQRVYLPKRILPSDGNPKAENNADRAIVAEAAREYFESPDRLYGDKVSDDTIQREKPIHRMMVYLHAAGATYAEIANQTGYTPTAVRMVLSQPWARQRLVQVLNETGRDQVKQFLTTQVAPSLQVLQEIRDNEKARETARIAAAKEILDRALGKATQHVTSENTNKNVPTEVSRLDAEIAAVREQLAKHGAAPEGLTQN